MRTKKPPIIKTPLQVDGIRRSCQTAVRVLRLVKDYIVPGMSTGELNNLIDIAIRRQNATPATLNYRGYPASCCISVNDCICHGVPNRRKLDWGDVVKIDVTTVLDDYYGDTCYTWIVGKASEDAARIYAAARECLWAGIAAIKPGRPIGEVSRAVRTTADRLKCSVVHQYCGHGVGLALHEPPNVVYDSYDGDEGPVMVPGMTFTVEPMINLGKSDAVVDAVDGWSSYTVDGRLSAQFEHTVLVTAAGHEILTDWGDETTLSPDMKLPEGICQSL